MGCQGPSENLCVCVVFRRLEGPLGGFRLQGARCTETLFFQGGTNRVLGKPYFCPLPKRGRFDENDEKNDEFFAFYPLKTKPSPLIPPKTTKMMKMAGDTHMVWRKPGLFFPDFCRPIFGHPEHTNRWVGF